MSVAHRAYWELVDMGFESDFCRWIRDAYPVLFKELSKQFNKKKGDSSPSAITHRDRVESGKS